MPYQNRRVYYPTHLPGFAPFSSTSFTPVHGAQSLGVNTNFTLENIQELGQISVYQIVEQVPEIEVTCEKVLDGYPLLYHLATQGSPGPSLAARSAQRATFAVSIYGDTQNSASGTPLAQMYVSGLYFQSEAFAFTTDTSFKETTTLVGNNIQWLQSGFTFTPNFTNTDSPLALAGSGGVQIRRDMIFYPVLASGDPLGSLERATGLDVNGQLNAFLTILPTNIANISSSGTNDRDSGGNFSCHITAINVNTNMNRDSILELGRKEPYFRFANFPVEVNSDITIITKIGNLQNAYELGLDGFGNNLTNQTIKIRIREGTWIDLGTKNKCKGVTYGGGDTGGGQVNCTYSYLTYNDMTITHPTDSVLSPGIAYPY